MPPLVITDQLTKRYGNMTALAGCSLEVHPAEVFGLLGPNGAGKTTLIRLLLGYLFPTTGRAEIGGFDCAKQSDEVRKITSYLPGDARLFPSMRGQDVLQFFADVRGGDVSKSRALSERLELDLSRRVSYMSTGMRQKLALAATLASHTPLVILDEPTANLDPSVRSTIIALVLEAKQAGRTVIFSSHVMSEVEEACDRVVILRRGQVVHTQIMSELKQQHRIRAKLEGAWSNPPVTIAEQLVVSHGEEGAIMLETPAPLAPLLGWLATLPLADIRIEPVGLRAVYDRFHTADAAFTPSAIKNVG